MDTNYGQRAVAQGDGDPGSNEPRPEHPIADRPGRPDHINPHPDRPEDPQPEHPIADPDRPGRPHVEPHD